MSAGLRPNQDPARGGRFYDQRGIFLLGLAALVIWLNVSMLVSVVMGAIFAVVLHPLMNKLKFSRLGSVGRSGVITFGFAISFLLPIGIIVFLAAEEALAKIQSLGLSNVNVSELSTAAWIKVLGLKSLVAYVSEFLPVSDLQMNQLLNRSFATAGTWAVKALQGVLANLPGSLFSMLIVLLTMFFLLIDGQRTVRFLSENSIFDRAHTKQVFASVVSLCYSVVVASIAAGAVQSTLIIIACLFAGTKGVVMIGLVSFVLSFIPMLGTAPVTLGLTLKALITGNYFAAMIFLISVFVVGLSDNIVRPYVLKGGASLHPLIGFVAAFGALDMIGFYGVFIGPLIAGLFFTVLPVVARTYRAASDG